MALKRSRDWYKNHTPVVTKEGSQIRVMEVKKLHMERHYEDSHILFLESRAQSMSLQICISLFTIFSGSNIYDLERS